MSVPGKGRLVRILVIVGSACVGLVVLVAAAGGFAHKNAAGDIAGDVTHGEILFRKCVACHSLEPGGSNRVGPRLYGLFGRRAGAVSDYNYTEALTESGVVWTADTLDVYLAGTTDLIPGTKMYAFMSRANDRADLIAFLYERTAPGAEGGGCDRVLSDWIPLPWC